MDLSISSKIETIQSDLNKQIAHWGLEKIQLGRVPLVILIGPGHRLYDKRNLTVADFQHDVLLDTPQRAWSASGLLKEYAKATPKHVISMTSYPNLRYGILEAGLAYTIKRLPPPEEIEQHRLRCIPLPNCYQKFAAIVDPKRQLPEAANRFLTILREKLKNYDSFICDFE